MGTVFPFNLKRILSLKESRDLLPVVRRVTEDSQIKVQLLVKKLESVAETDTEKKKTIEKEINDLVEQWQSKIEKLGGEPKGLWLVDFDCGVGYFCWKFPEDDLSHFHGYTEGFKSRTPIDEDFDTKHGDGEPLDIGALRSRHLPPEA